MLLTTSLPSHPKTIHRILNRWPSTKKLLFMALMAALAGHFTISRRIAARHRLCHQPLCHRPDNGSHINVFALRCFHLYRNDPFIVLD